MTIQDSTDTNGELSTAWGRGGPKVSPRAAPGGGQVAPTAGTDQHAGGMRAVLHGADAPSSPGLVRLVGGRVLFLLRVTASRSSAGEINQLETPRSVRSLADVTV